MIPSASKTLGAARRHRDGNRLAGTAAAPPPPPALRRPVGPPRQLAPYA
eukprot:CAMPEP_0179022764 /NCGR_PEP_ID=MMETSP0796-20121207/6580_1 /TAXON_ID=73915 /ORGANISM="Pyrodinium bahamense, Strain pbaha01" /LENGTH=48 /DNA_ID= /DNA_START= /DNA_END= /DNA_ORIENTATION=